MKKNRKEYQRMYYKKHKAKFKLARRIDYIKNQDAYKLRAKQQRERKNVVFEVIAPVAYHHQSPMNSEF